ncbi:hypothetical protein CR513_57219, partial [Mucuna pruriens]
MVPIPVSKDSRPHIQHPKRGRLIYLDDGEKRSIFKTKGTTSHPLDIDETDTWDPSVNIYLGGGGSNEHGNGTRERRKTAPYILHKGHIKAQALADFITEMSTKSPEIEVKSRWFLSVDRASNQIGSGI